MAKIQSDVAPLLDADHLDGYDFVIEIKEAIEEQVAQTGEWESL